jgi:hypothetical protein
LGRRKPFLEEPTAIAPNMQSSGPAIGEATKTLQDENRRGRQWAASAPSRRLLTVGVSSLRPNLDNDYLGNCESSQECEDVIDESSGTGEFRPSGDEVEVLIAKLSDEYGEVIDNKLRSKIARRLLDIPASQFSVPDAVEFAFLLGLNHSKRFNVFTWLDEIIKEYPAEFAEKQREYLAANLPDPSRQNISPSANNRAKNR